jgi:hypothetical protein
LLTNSVNEPAHWGGGGGGGAPEWKKNKKI